MEESHQLFPHAASELGLEEFESELGENNADVHRRSTALVRETLGAVENLPDTAFRGDDWLDRRGFLSMLRSTLLFDGDPRQSAIPFRPTGRGFIRDPPACD